MSVSYCWQSATSDISTTGFRLELAQHTTWWPLCSKVNRAVFSAWAVSSHPPQLSRLWSPKRLSVIWHGTTPRGQETWEYSSLSSDSRSLPLSSTPTLFLAYPYRKMESKHPYLPGDPAFNFLPAAARQGTPRPVCLDGSFISWRWSSTSSQSFFLRLF